MTYLSGEPVKTEQDDDFDGKFENLFTTLKDGSQKQTLDSDRDGIIDTWLLVDKDMRLSLIHI